jgi:nucleoid-associated protein YgaU
VQGMRHEMQRMRTEINQANAQDIQRLEARMSRLEQSVQQLEAQRARDREEIVAVLSARMAEVMRQSPRGGGGGGGGRTHTVASGETLSAIASAWGVSSQEIMRANNITNPNLLRVGQSLIIP